jgi:hypothetical protein
VQFVPNGAFGARASCEHTKCTSEAQDCRSRDVNDSAMRKTVLRSCGIVVALAAIGCEGSNKPSGLQAEPNPVTAGAGDQVSGGVAAGSGGTAGTPPSRAGAAPVAGTSGNTSGAAGVMTPSVDVSGAGGGAAARSDGGAGSAASAGSGGMDAGSTGVAGQPSAATALTNEQTLIPDVSWPCGMPQGIPGPGSSTPIFEIDFAVGEVHDLGTTQFGHRTQIDVTGGTVKGAKLDAALMERGLDYQLTLVNGVVELEQIHILTVGDTPVYMRNCGTAPGPGDVRVVLDFEAPIGSAVEWLNEGVYIGTRAFDADKKSLHMRVFEVTAAANPNNAVRIIDPVDVPNQSWECAKASGSRGDVLYTESVGIGAGSVAVGASKRGTRNIIPITGGTSEGMIAGKVLAGGADFQLLADGVFGLDARYTLETADGELIIVRNCGPFGALVPVFETRVDGKYARLNETRYLSSDPSGGAGFVNLTIYEER